MMPGAAGMPQQPQQQPMMPGAAGMPQQPQQQPMMPGAAGMPQQPQQQQMMTGAPGMTRRGLGATQTGALEPSEPLAITSLGSTATTAIVQAKPSDSEAPEPKRPDRPAPQLPHKVPPKTPPKPPTRQPAKQERPAPKPERKSEKVKFFDDDDDDDDTPEGPVSPAKPEPFKLPAKDQSKCDEWSKRLPEMKSYDWGCSPVRMFPLNAENEKKAEELLASRSSKLEVFTTLASESPDKSFNLYFGPPGCQVKVEEDLKQKVVLVLAEPQKTSFKIPKRKYPKFRITAEPAEGTISKGGAVEVVLTLRMTCTTSVELQVPIIFWHGGLKDYEKALDPEKSEGMSVHVCYFRGKIQSQLSTRLDIEEVQLYRPPIGSGAFGTVYRGRYRGLDIALKLMKDQEDLTQEMFDDFRREVNMFETLRHPCIVNFVGAVFFPLSLALVTELCKYGSLPSAMQKHGPWSNEMKIKAMYDCARAMDFLHQSSIIHRDLKPDNLLVTSLEIHAPAICKLSDFGTTKGENSLVRSMVDMNKTKGIGTPLYMAPEMMRGITDYSTKADVYSFGIMIASVIDDGKEPYQGDTRIPSSWQFTNLVIQGLRPNVAKIGEVPPAFANLMKRCWVQNPNDRPAFNQIVEELETMLPEC